MVLLALTGCKDVHYHRYTYKGDLYSGKLHEYTLVQYEEGIDIGVDCGFFVQTSGAEEQGLMAHFTIKESHNIDLEDLDIQVYSQKLGALKIRKFSNLVNKPYSNYGGDLIFHKEINWEGEKNILEMLKGDKLTIKMGNGVKYGFWFEGEK